MASNGSKCAAFNCENYQAFCPNLAFHRFPKVNEKKKESYERCKKWLINCRRADLDDMFKKDRNYLNRNCRLCSNHFEDSCFKDIAIKTLKNDAVPTKFDVPNPPPSVVPKRKPPKQRLMPPSPSNRHKENKTITCPSPEKISFVESTIELANVQRNEIITCPSPEKISCVESTRELAKAQKNERIIKELRLKVSQQRVQIFRLKKRLASSCCNSISCKIVKNRKDGKEKMELDHLDGIEKLFS